MKLLYIPTGNVFTLPDEKALEYFKKDNANYRILDAGFVEEQEPVKLPPQTVQELVMAEPEPEDEEPVNISDEVIVEEPQKEEDLMKLSKDELFAYCRRLGIKGVTKSKTSKAKMIELINGVKLDDVTGV